MGLVFWWMMLVWVVVIAGYWIVRYLMLTRWKRKQDTSDIVPIAHSDRLTNLAEYKKAIKQYRRLLRLAAGTMTLALLMTILLTARPASIAQITPAQKSRDIMLCLDVSGSVLKVDTRLVNRFNALVDNFSGQRFGLTVFNSSSVGVIPLSDDYQFITAHLKEVSSALTEQKGQGFTDLTSGTLADFDKGTSLVSDGLASCISNLGANTQRRSQSIILATDNEANGKAIVDMKQAVGLAEQRNIRMYAIDPGATEPARAADHTQLKTLAEQTGGGYYTLGDSDVAGNIIDEVSKQEAAYEASTAVIAYADQPKVFLYIAFLAIVASLVFAWRLKL